MLSAAEAEMVDELAWYFMLAAPLYREDLDFPYATLAQLSEDGYTFYFPIHNAQQMTSQLFGRENWLPEIAHPYYHEDAARFEKPTETGVYTAYGCTEMESTVEPDNYITVTFQLIDTPAYPGLERYGRHRFDFAVCQGEEGPYLQLQSCEFIEPAVPLPPEPPDNQIDRSSLPPEISQSPDLPTADTIYHYHVPNPKSLDLEALIANFSRLDQEKDILTKLPDSYVLQESQESGVKRILSKGWSFAGTEGILIADYTTDPTTTETKNDTLLRVDYWTLNYDLEMFRQVLQAINSLNLPGIDEYEQEALALYDIYLSKQGDYLSVEEYAEPYLPSNSHIACIPVCFRNSDGTTIQIEAVFWSADEAAEFFPDALKEDSKTNSLLLSGIMIRLNFANDVGV